MTIRERLEGIEVRTLAPQACLSVRSKGRSRAEAPHPIRTAFQRDRDRIIHSKAFRRLKHKTQVFLSPFGDHYRTRLTHTLEVSQIARTIARALRLNEDLAEAVALGHDLGHTPFGHSGEAVLDSLLEGGFRHAEQSLRVVEKLEHDGKGLFLTWEVRDGIIGHSKGRGEILGEGAKNMPATLEGQVVRVSDVIAYVNHDLDDAIRAEIVTQDRIPPHIIRTLGKWPATRIDRLVMDVVESSLACGLERIAMTPRIMRAMTELRDFLYDRVYFGGGAREELAKTDKIVRELYAWALAHPEGHVKDFPPGDSMEKRAADFIAGMTDRFALDLYERVFLPRSWRT